MVENENVAQIQAEIAKEISDLMGDEAQPAAQEQEVKQPVTEAQTAQSSEPPPNEQTEQPEKEFWEVEEAVTEQKTDDWKAKYEEANSKLSKIESNKVLKKLSEVIDAPDFDIVKFIETQVPQRVDYSKVPLENLYKASLEADKVANYTEEEIETLWEEKKAELAGKSAAEKALKSQLVKEFQSQEQPNSDDEPELLKLWKESTQERQAQMEKDAAEFKQVTQTISDFTKGLVGKKMGGLEITNEHIEEINKRMSVDYYRGKDGVIDAKRIALDRTKAVLFDKVVPYLRTQAVIEAKKQMTRPSNTSGGGEVGDADGRTENEKILDQAAKEFGLKSYKEL